MKRILVAVAAAGLAGAALASPTPQFSGTIEHDRSLPPYQEMGSAELLVMAAARGYRFDAGEPTQELVVQESAQT